MILQFVANEIGARFIVSAAVVCAGVVSAHSLWEALLALRAKTRAKYLILAKSHNDSGLRAIIKRAAGHDLKEKEIDLAIRAIESKLSELSEQDRKFVEEGIHQSSRIGSRRYITKVLSN